MRVLVFCASYPPACRGGTARAVEGVIARLGRDIDFRVFTRDRDDGARAPFPGVVTGRWHRRGEATVYYAPPSDLAPHRMAVAAREAAADGYYVNTLFSPTFGILPVALRWFGLMPQRPMIVAARGELCSGALRFKRHKKASFVRLARRLPAYRDVLWQAGTSGEGEQIRASFSNAAVAVARDLTALTGPPPTARPPKRSGDLRVAYLSRITAMKNLAGALRLVGKVRGAVQVDVYGQVEDPEYYRQCVRIAGSLPANVQTCFHGEVPHERVLETLASHHVFLLPTFGESFGHAILEALLAGAIPVISDQTPWRDLAREGAGWDVPLDDELGLVRALQTCADMDDEQFSDAWLAARELGRRAATSPAAVDENLALFRRAFAGHEGP